MDNWMTYKVTVVTKGQTKKYYTHASGFEHAMERVIEAEKISENEIRLIEKADGRVIG